MKYIISERQYNLLIEQPIGLGTVGGYDYQKPEAIMKMGELMVKDAHFFLPLLAFASSFIPFVGPFLSAGIGLGDAALYYKENDTKTAGLVATFSLMPGSLAIINRIPAIKKLGVKGMSALAEKIAKGDKITDSVELAVIEGIKKGTDFVKSSLDTHVKTLAQQAASKPLSSSIKTSLANLGKTGLKYLGVGVGYSVGYDITKNYFDAKKEDEDANKLRTALSDKN
jgi:hypothetical protein